MSRAIRAIHIHQAAGKRKNAESVISCVSTIRASQQNKQDRYVKKEKKGQQAGFFYITFRFVVAVVIMKRVHTYRFVANTE